VRRLAALALVLLSAGLAGSAAPAEGASRPGAATLRAYLTKMTAINRSYVRLEARGTKAANETTLAVQQALRGDREELDRLVGEYRTIAADTSRLARRANAIRPAPRTKHVRYVAALRLVARAYTESANGLDRLDPGTQARVQRISRDAIAAIRAWRNAVVAAGRRTLVAVPAWVRRAGTE
jgi:hypothetical protein